MKFSTDQNNCVPLAPVNETLETGSMAYVPSKPAFDAKQATDAFEAHRRMVLKEVQNPSLRSNPFWQMCRQAAYDDFAASYLPEGK